MKKKLIILGCGSSVGIPRIDGSWGKFNRNEKKQALETLYTLNENFISQKHWVGKSYLLIAKIFISMDENFQAKATLNSLVDNSEIETIREEAIELLNKLNKNE